MKIYARLEEQRVAEIIALNIEPEKIYHPSLSWIDISSLDIQPNMSDVFFEGRFIPPSNTAQDPKIYANYRLAAEIEIARRVIAPLEDAVDIGIATDAELEKLDKWKRYRIALSRVDVTKTADIEWPTRP